MASGISSSYFGKAGHLFVMSEFLIRGWNVAIPEVDHGDDVFVVKHTDNALYRVQVKSSNVTLKKRTLHAQFLIDKSALYNPTSYEVYFAFAIRSQEAWSHLLIITKTALADILGEAVKAPRKINLVFQIVGDTVYCRGVDLTRYRNDFQNFRTF